MRCYFILGLFILPVSVSIAQQRTSFADKLEIFREKISRGSNVADTSLLRSAQLFRDSLTLLGYRDMEAEMYVVTGRMNQQLGRMSQTETHYKQALELGKSVHDSLWVAGMWDRLGDFYGLEERNYLALDCHLQALKLRERFDKTRTDIADSYHSIAKAYIQLDELHAADKYLNLALKLKMELKDTMRLGIITTLQADLYRKRGEFAKAEKLYLKDIPKRKSKANFEGLTISYLGLAENYVSWGKDVEAERYFKLALDAAKTINRQRNIGLILLKLGEFYNQKGQKLKAHETFQEAITKCTGVDSRIYQINAYRSLYQLSKKEGDLTKALEYLELWSSLRDSSARESLNMKLDDLKASFVLKDREQKILKLDEENRKSRQFQKVLLAGIGILLLLSAFLIFLYHSRSKTLQSLHQEQKHTQALLSEKLALVDDLQKTRYQLVHSEKMASIGVMTAGIAHELNNPVSAFSAGMAALKMDYSELYPLIQKLGEIGLRPDDERIFQEAADLAKGINIQEITAELDALIKSMENSAERTSVIIHGLKTFARDTGEDKMPYSIEEGIDAALTLLHHKMSTDLSIEKNYLTDTPVICQPSKINQVILNLLDNAVFAAGAHGKITIHTSIASNKYIVRIHNTGHSIDADHLQKIFEPFFTTKEVGQGTGLGLAISYAIIAQHEGTITVESDRENGTAFTITLPIT
ncbi:MAG: GHKL domain-containing protein [Saprospiraceae bacterium]|nr:GHKL domain-containing protein [Saprospiraceae bacterium]